MKKVALFASGSGTNVENIVNYFNNSSEIEISIILSNNSEAFVLERAKKFNIPTFVFNRTQLNNSNDVIDVLNNYDVDYIVLAGFLWLIPNNLIKKFPKRIINIHPALLPKYGGKGMYGDNVHKSVVENNETESGITIHFVNEEYDKGDIIFQSKCKVLSTDTAKDVAKKIHTLEYKYFPEIIEKLIKDNI
jgi:phosphoribosylglycinamide formyltransferase-1